MPVTTSTYKEIRAQMRPGDVIAFGGKGHFSSLIKFATCSSVSHLGVILQTKACDDTLDRFFNQVIESTSLHGFNGVSISRLSDRIGDNYDGEIWWLPLKKEIREKQFDKVKFYDFLFLQAEARKPYDTEQAIKSALDLLDQLPFGKHGPGYASENFEKFFCSELVAAGLEVAGVVENINASEVTPIDLCRWNIFEDTYHQLQGEAEKEISRYNSMDPKLWCV